MSAPEFPSRTDVRTGTTALVVDRDGIGVFRYSESLDVDNAGWIETRQYARESPDSISLRDETVKPPILGEFAVSIGIEVPVERVFDYVADIETHPEYADFVERIEIISEVRVGEEVVFKQFHRGSSEPIPSEFVAYESYERLAWVTHKPDGDLRIQYWFEPSDTGTILYHSGIGTLSAESNDTFRADLGALVERYEKNEDEMAALKLILEG